MSDETAPTPRAGTRRTWGQRLVILLNLCLVAVSLLGAGTLHYAGARAGEVSRVALDRSLTDIPGDDSGERVINILLVGSDSSANLDPDDPVQVGRHGERLGDVIIIAHLDERSGDIALLSLPRDLWVPIAGSNRSDRINRSFVTGGPAGLIETIEDTFDIPIHHYVNVDFAGFEGLVEAVGTVEVPFDAPARDWNVNAEPEPRSQTGFLVEEAGCHALGPEQALAYVRSRYYQTRDADGTWHTDPSSDLGRIRRQQDFLRRLLQKAIDLGARNPMVLADLVDTGIHNVAIDSELTPAFLLELSATYRSFEPGDLQSYTYPASDATVGASKVLRPEHDRAEALLNLFRGDRFDDPATISVTVLDGDDSADPGTGDGGRDGSGSDDDGPGAGRGRSGDPDPTLVDEVADALDDAGYEIDDPDDGHAPPGIWIRHGAGAAQAAETVAAGLAARLDPEGAGASIHIEQVDEIKGRRVVVAVGPLAPAGPTIDQPFPEFVATPSVPPELTLPTRPVPGAGQFPLHDHDQEDSVQNDAEGQTIDSGAGCS